MNIFEITMWVYLIGIFATSPLVFWLTRGRFDAKLKKGQIAPGTEMMVLGITQIVSVFLWPLVIPTWLFEVARQRLAQLRS